MDLNSPFFDRIRVKPEPAEQSPAEGPRCDHPGCGQIGLHRAPMGRLREGQYFCFCLDHVREYNQSYNYFKGMSDDDVMRYQREAVVGHRPTWSMGVNRGAKAFREDGVDPDALFRDFGQRARGRRAEPVKPSHPVATMKAFHALGFDEPVDPATAKARYKELVKRLHPDANAGDRSREDKLREIIQAYNHLKAARLV
ncbi:MAG: J domain-containing protein [Methylobacteriaceae bacterium]|nr:J domain-containing protein [Methylobacteriaceae bacterium]